MLPILNGTKKQVIPQLYRSVKPSLRRKKFSAQNQQLLQSNIYYSLKKKQKNEPKSKVINDNNFQRVDFRKSLRKENEILYSKSKSEIQLSSQIKEKDPTKQLLESINNSDKYEKNNKFLSMNPQDNRLTLFQTKKNLKLLLLNLNKKQQKVDNYSLNSPHHITSYNRENIFLQKNDKGIKNSMNSYYINKIQNTKKQNNLDQRISAQRYNFNQSKQKIQEIPENKKQNKFHKKYIEISLDEILRRTEQNLNANLNFSFQANKKNNNIQSFSSSILPGNNIKTRLKVQYRIIDNEKNKAKKDWLKFYKREINQI